MIITKAAKVAALGFAAALALTACGTPQSSTTAAPSADGGDVATDSYILGTTDIPTRLDPATSYDLPSWNLQYSGYEQLLRFDANSGTPTGDAAESCEYTDPKTVECKLRAGNKFANGHDLTSSDVKFSFERNLLINEPDGASILLASIADNSGAEGQKLTEGAIETPDDLTVIFHLNRADTTFTAVISSAASSIVDEETYALDRSLTDEEVLAANGSSGPLLLTGYTKGEQAVFEASESYTGTRASVAKSVYVQYFQSSTALRQAIEAAEVDVAWRTLSPTDLSDLASKDTVKVLDGQGSEYRYWVFRLQNEVSGQKAVRQAIAQLIDRDSITQNVYDGIKNPAYSQVPPGFAGQKDSFKEKYGSPNVDAAKKILDDAGIATPVAITLGFPPEHYGAEAVDEATELVKQLNDSGLFTAKQESAEWTQYQKLYKEGTYDLFLLGWYPDFLDADNYLSPFLPSGGFMDAGYDNPEVNKLLDDELAETDTATRNGILGQIQDIIAEDVPIIPSWNGKNTAVALPEMNGVLETLDANYIFRMWAVSKG
ncbi:MAG: ABC transporter substrate-binding protein [Propionibacteriaceae bacterium]|jgi:peptide/nickel transport system substrate-binding protein|nr:ABC transporter substrate-binding protein [Propionibacteriaceae bacterium]